MENNLVIDKKKINKILDLLNDRRMNKLHVLNSALAECSFAELEVLYTKLPPLFKGLFSLSYLKRKDYSSIFQTTIQLNLDAIDYFGKVAYIIKRNSSILKDYIIRKRRVDELFFVGDYENALIEIHNINREISYSYWASSYEIMIERLTNGKSSAISLHNNLYNKNNSFWFGKFCNAAYYTSSLEVTSKESQDLVYVKEDNTNAKIINQIIKDHFYGFDNPGIAGCLCIDFKSSIIDIYNNFIHYLPLVPQKIKDNVQFREYIQVVAISTEDPFVKFLLRLWGSSRSQQQVSAARLKIINSYLTTNYSEVIELASIYVKQRENCFCFDILFCYLNSLIKTNQDLPELDKDASIYDRVKFHLFNVLRKNDSTYHLHKLKGICQSIFNIFEIRNLYSFIEALEKKDLLSLFDRSWRYSTYNHLGVTSYYKTREQKKEFLVQSGILSETISNWFDDENEKISPDLFEVTLALRKDQQVKKSVVQTFENGEIPPYLKDIVASYVFSNYVEEQNLIKSISFYVDSILSKQCIEIYINEVQSKIIQENYDILVDKQPLVFSIFLNLTNADINSIYLAYKKYLRNLGVKRASEIHVQGNLLQDFFLSKVANQKVLSLHVLRFKSVSQVMDERILICSNLNDYYDNKKYVDEISGIIRDKKMLELNNQIDENKIYVDVQSIIENELDEAKALYKIYEMSSEDSSLLHDSISQLLSSLQEIGLNFDIIQNGVDVSQEKLDTQYSFLKRIFLCVRDQFLFNPKSGLDNYLSTRIRHGTLINQLRNHFEVENLISNKKNNEYISNTYWCKSMFLLDDVSEYLCNKSFLNFSDRIDKIIFAIKDVDVQVSTEKITDKPFACFNFDISLFENSIQELHARTELNSYDAIISEIISLLWQQTDVCLESMKSRLVNSQNKMLEELHNLEKELSHTHVKNQENWSKFHDAVTRCTNEIQDDIQVVIRWFNRNSKVNFDFTIRQVIETCLRFVNENSKFKIETIVECESYTELQGKYFATLYDMFHDIMNNVLYYNKDHNVDRKCFITIVEKNDKLNISISNPIEQENENVIRTKAQEINQNLATLLRGGKSRVEGNSGCIKIFNAVHNHLGSHNNDYKNSVEDCKFVVNIILDLKPLRK